MPARTKHVLLLEDALVALGRHTGLEAIQEMKVPDDADAAIALRKGLRVWRFNVVLKPWLNKTVIEILKERMREREGDWLLVTQYAQPNVADDLRTRHLPFIDLAGNAFIDREGLCVFIKGQRGDKDRTRQKGELFRPAELKVVFALLCQKDAITKTHEQIREMTGVGIGTINRLIHALEAEGHILKLKGGPRRLVHKKLLLEKWVMAYPQRLRPKQMFGRFKGPVDNWWKNLEPTVFGVQWGGEIAARTLTRHLKPQGVTLYATARPERLIIDLKLRTDPGGDVEILKRFWNLPTEAGHDNIVPPLLVYADLLATGEERNIETARMIYDQYLTGLVGES